MDTVKELLQYTYFGNTIAQYLGFFGCFTAGNNRYLVCDPTG
jgi:hypothetical protein